MTSHIKNIDFHIFLFDVDPAKFEEYEKVQGTDGDHEWSNSLLEDPSECNSE